MNFIVFPTVSTNIFPQANSVGGGQLMSEYNLRSRESIATPESVKYMIGPSYVHGEEDFKVQILSDELGTKISSTVLQILPGRGLINGHFVESLTSVTIDLNQARAKAEKERSVKLSGNLCIGIRAMYSTEATMAGAIMVENDKNMYEGIQVVILPESEFKLPVDVPEDVNSVTAHLKLASFKYINGSITNLINNYPYKCQMIPSDRLSNVDKLLSDQYVTRSGLNPKKLYTFAGKGYDISTGKDTWCDSTDSLMVWDANPKFTSDKPLERQAEFDVSLTGAVQLKVPHKQVDGMTSTDGNNQYYESRYLDLPVADFSSNTSGTITKNYTKQVKSVLNKINTLFNYPAGKQRGYIESLHADDTIPPINPSWNVGDYIIVGQDYTITYMLTDSSTGIPTMRVVIPGTVTKVKFHSKVDNSMVVPIELKGIELSSNDNSDGEAPNTTDDDRINKELWAIEDNNWNGIVDTDYFKYVVYQPESEDYSVYYYTVAEASKRTYCDPIPLLGQVPLAQEDVIGGFYNVPDNALDNGYIYRNDQGYLQLLDYELLRTGVLAYQLGEDYICPTGLNIEELQQILDEYINDRVAFPNATQAAKDKPNVINITLELAASDTPQTLNIYDIDSRFNTSVYIHINGTGNSNITINVSNCEKVRIDSNIPATDSGSPILNIYNSNLYYDAAILDYATNISGLSLWYEKFDDSDPNLLVNGMTITELDAPIITEDMEYWNISVKNDNHYVYALKSITFGSDGNIIGAGLYVSNETTSNIQEGPCVISSEFVLPQGSGLVYPLTRLTKQIKITGSFVNAYVTSSQGNQPDGYMILDTNFTALTQAYNSYSDERYASGVISFYVVATHVTSVVGLPLGTSIDGWESKSFHVFEGSVL